VSALHETQEVGRVLDERVESLMSELQSTRDSHSAAVHELQRSVDTAHSRADDLQRGWDTDMAALAAALGEVRALQGAMAEKDATLAAVQTHATAAAAHATETIAKFITKLKALQTDVQARTAECGAEREGKEVLAVQLAAVAGERDAARRQVVDVERCATLALAASNAACAALQEKLTTAQAGAQAAAEDNSAQVGALRLALVESTTAHAASEEQLEEQSKGAQRLQAQLDTVVAEGEGACACVCLSGAWCVWLCTAV
jgi:chromosome segregation ATPase